MIRTARIHDNRISYIQLVPFKNHYSLNYKERSHGCLLCQSYAVKRVMKFLWEHFGIGLKG